VNELTAPKDVADLPALIESAMRHLQEAKGIEEVRHIRDIMEAARVYAAKHRAAVEAQNECALLVVLSERKIGEKIEEARANGDLLKRHETRQWVDPEKRGITPATLAEIGVRTDQSHDYARLKDTPVEALREVVDEANARGEQVKKVDFRRKARESATKGGAKNVRQPTKKSDPTKPRVDYLGRPDWLNNFSLWVQSGHSSLAKWGDAVEMARTAIRCNVPINTAHADQLIKFLTAVRDATVEEADRAAA
jgi:hypothetical protein